MKSVAAYYLLLFYCAALFKPALPLVSDYLSHTFSRSFHFSTVHHEHGPDHTHEEVANTVAGDHEERDNSRSYEPVSVHLLFEQTEAIDSTPVEQALLSILLLNTSSPFLHVITPPPKS